MDKKQITINYLCNILFTVLNMFFPLITFPYASRILGATNIGLVTFVLSIVTYFTTVASLGIPNYGIREIAKVRNNHKHVSKVYSEIFSINFYSTLVCAIVYYGMILCIPAFQSQRVLYAVIGISILLNFVNVDWMYKGFEDYVYITQRSIIFKLITVVMLFVFVHKSSDYVIYGLIQVLAISGSNIVNVFTAHRYVRLSWKKLCLRQHLRPIIILFASVAVISVYTNLDSIMLGIISGQRDVGFYTAANKVNGMVISVVTALGVVLFPRLSFYIKNNQVKEFKSLIIKSVHLVLMISIPACAGLFVMAPQIILLLSGAEFLPAVTSMRIQLLIILFVGLSNLTGIQILLPLGKEKIFFYSVLVGAVVDFLSNLLMIPLFHQNGAALSSTIAEFFVTFIQCFYTRKYMKGLIWNKRTFHYVLSSLLMSGIIWCFTLFKWGNIFTVLISTVVGVFFYFSYHFFRKDPLVMQILNAVPKYKIKHQ